MGKHGIPGYTLIKQLSTYGPGETWKAHSERADQFIIIHFLSLDGLINQNDQQKFLREASICARLSHPGLVRFLAQGIVGSKFWFATELAQGTDLSTFVEKRQPVSVDTAVSIIQQALDVIIYLHQQGIVHRGLRPESLLIEERGKRLTVHLADLGSAKCFQTAGLEATVTKLGERGFPVHAYIALEALENPQKFDPRSDVYALGALLYFLLAGSHPYDATDETFLITQIIAEKSHPLHDLRPSLSEPLVGVVERAMERDIATRYGSAEEMRQALRQAIGKSDSASDSAPAPGTIIHVHGDLVGTEQETKGGEKMRIRILFLAADPTDASRLRLGEEFRELQEKLKRAKLRDQFGLELPQLSVRPADISQALLDVEPQIIHFSGHGSSTGALYFENLTGQIQLVQPNALAALFEQFANQVNCVLLNACYSEAQAKAIAEHIEYVVGMNQAISDKAAIAFAIGFYQALGAGRTIEEAYKLGCVQIGLQGIPEHLTPVLIRRA